MANANMTAIQTVTVGSGGAAVIEFTNIPQTYTDLAIVISSRNTSSSGSDNMNIAINDSSSNFSGRYLFTNTNGTIVSGTDTTPAGAYNGGNTTANTFSNVSIYFPNYSGSTNKSFSVDSVAENNGALSNLYFDAKLWSNTAAITKISFTCTTGNFAQYSTATLYGVKSTAAIVKATGGTIYSDADYVYHLFTSSGTFTPTQNLTADYLVVAGGGAGGNGGEGGGGGAGGMRCTVTGTGGNGSLESPLSLTASTAYTVTVGAGGAPVSGNNGGNGSNSVFATITSTGGGGGGKEQATSTDGDGQAGGSGGGGGNRWIYNPTVGGAASPSGQGFAGGGSAVDSDNAGAGGGGASQVGTDAGNAIGGKGGDGRTTLISGSSATYAGGGGGGVRSAAGTRGLGGAGGGGAGAIGTTQPVAGTANTGGGGGGANNNIPNDAKSGGSGIVIVRYSA
jgi:hypothetical protein